MRDVMQTYPHENREEAYFEVLESFLRTSAQYFDIDALTPPAVHRMTAPGSEPQ